MGRDGLNRDRLLGRPEGRRWNMARMERPESARKQGWGLAGRVVYRWVCRDGRAVSAATRLVLSVHGRLRTGLRRGMKASANGGTRASRRGPAAGEGTGRIGACGGHETDGATDPATPTPKPSQAPSVAPTPQPLPPPPPLLLPSLHFRTISLHFLLPMPSVAEESTAGTGAAARRRSVDVGGLALALGDNLGSGQGWGGWDESERDRDLTWCVHTAPTVPQLPILDVYLTRDPATPSFSATCTPTHTSPSQITINRQHALLSRLLILSDSHPAPRSTSLQKPASV